MSSPLRNFAIAATITLATTLMCACNKTTENATDATSSATATDHAEAWNKSNQQGLQYLTGGDLDNAEKYLLVSLKEAEACGANDQRVAVSLNNLASVYEKKGMYDQCLPYLRRSRKIFEATLAKGNTVVPVIIGNEARILSEQGKYKEAQPLYATAVAAQDKAHSAELPDTMRGYAKVLKALKRDAEAKTMEEMADAASHKE